SLPDPRMPADLVTRTSRGPGGLVEGAGAARRLEGRGFAAAVLQTVKRIVVAVQPQCQARSAATSASAAVIGGRADSPVQPHLLHARVGVERVVRRQILHVRPAGEVLVA